jgi:MIP family channel proteins
MNPTSRACLAELIGTFTLTFIGAGAIIVNTAPGGSGLIAIALAHGLALSMAVFATGHISGGHINPAVTCAMLATRRIALPNAAAYIVSQLLGATLAAFLLSRLFPAENTAAMLGATLGSIRDSMTVIAIEAILTFLLVTTIFGVAVDKRGPKNVYGFAIGLTVCFDILAAGPLTGASMNPARSFGPALIGGHWDIHQAYWLGPIVGGCAAALVYDLLLIPKSEKQGEGS